MLTIRRILCAEGLGGYFFNDEAAINKGLVEDGFTYQGQPLTPGFTAIRMPAIAICIMLVLNNGQMAYGD